MSVDPMRFHALFHGAAALLISMLLRGAAEKSRGSRSPFVATLGSGPPIASRLRFNSPIGSPHAKKVFAAGEISKKGNDIEFNVTSGSYSLPVTKSGRISKEGLLAYVEGEFRVAGFTRAAGATNDTPSTFIAPKALPVRDVNINLLRKYRITVTKRERRAQRRSRRRATRRH
jgi:hypothetical protein